MIKWTLFFIIIPFFAYAPSTEERFKPTEEEIIMYIASICEFRNLLGFKESSMKYDTINSLGYLGKYQLGRSAMKHLGLDYDYFRANIDSFTPLMQEKALNDLLNENRRMLRREMKLVGKRINGIVITESGLLAGAHLAGAGGVRKWLYQGEDLKDMNKTKVSDYVNEFSNAICR